MRYYAKFVGGIRNGIQIPIEEAETLSNGRRSEDLSEIRKQGGFVRREELDNRPLFDGYLSPMWDGYRYWVEGNLIPERDTPEEFKVDCNRVGIIRYETPEVYEMLSR